MITLQRALRKSNLFLIFLISLLFFGCRKKEVLVRVEGSVVNGVFEQPIENIEIKFYVKEIQGGTFSNSFKLLTTALTDGAGNFEVEFAHKTVQEYKIEVNHPDFFEFTQLINPDDWSLSEINKEIIELWPKSFINLSIKNQFPQNSDDNIVLLSANGNCDLCYIPSLISLNGMSIDTLFRSPSLGMRYWKYNYVVTKNSMTYNYIDSVYCWEGDTANITLLY
jgi:hypothetical protein